MVMIAGINWDWNKVSVRLSKETLSSVPVRTLDSNYSIISPSKACLLPA
jgi:hypothetical protein